MNQYPRYLRIVHSDTIEKAIQICKKYHPSKVLLFGSAARSAVLARDVDLVGT